MFGSQFSRDVVPHGDEGMVAGARGWLVTWQPHSGSRDETTNRASQTNKQTNKAKSSFMPPVTRLLPLKDSTACPDLPTAEDHMCSNGSLEGPFHTQTTTGSVCPRCLCLLPCFSTNSECLLGEWRRKLPRNVRGQRYSFSSG